MQIKSVRGAVVAFAAGAALLGVPATAQATGIPLTYDKPAATTPGKAATPVDSLLNTNSASSLSSQVTSQGTCLVQSISARVQCFTGQN